MSEYISLFEIQEIEVKEALMDTAKEAMAKMPKAISKMRSKVWKEE